MSTKGRVGVKSSVDLVLNYAVLGRLKLGKAAIAESKEISVRDRGMHCS